MRFTRVTGLLLPPMLLAASAVASPLNPTSNTTNRVSTGITAPELTDARGIYIPSSLLIGAVGDGTRIVLSFTVDEKGNARNVKVLKSANPELNERVVAGVLRSHFRPAQLDNQSIPMDMELTVTVQR